MSMQLWLISGIGFMALMLVMYLIRIVNTPEVSLAQSDTITQMRFLLTGMALREGMTQSEIDFILLPERPMRCVIPTGVPDGPESDLMHQIMVRSARKIHDEMIDEEETDHSREFPNRSLQA